MFKASDVKELRDKTGAGMLDCKKALEATNGNMNEAIDWLREKGISKAEKKASRVAAEGLCKIVTDGNKAVILEVNSETDFVAKNEEFTNFVDYLANTILANNLKTHEEVLSFDDNGEKVEAKLVALTAKIGEKLSFRRHELVEKNDNEVFGSYLHMGGKIGALVVLADTSIEVAKDVAMHVAAMAPVCATRSDVPADMVDHESKVIKEQVMNEGKPADIAEKMVTGRLNKFYKEICLEEQEFIKDSSVNVGTFVKNNGGSIVSMIRYADVLLLHAECLNELGQTSEAVQIVNNQIRTRAWGGNLPEDKKWNSGMSKDEFRDKVMDERLRELCFEGWRRIDLLRTNKFVELIKERNRWAKESGTIQDFHKRYPIPDTEIKTNDAFGPEDQNPGYSK